LEEPWWNAGRRARPQAEGRRKPTFPWRDPHPLLVRGLTTVHLPAFRFLYFVLSYFVIAGLDPAIHAAMRLSAAPRMPPVSMDHRVKPGGDEGVWLFERIDLLNSRAHASRERTDSSAPAEAGEGDHAKHGGGGV
jgi:hypothetical protein